MSPATFKIGAVVAAALLVLNSLYTLPEAQQAMVLRFGKLERVVTEPGLHAKIPFIQNVLYFDKRILETDASAEEVQTVDKKRVVVDSFTRWRIASAEKFFQAVRSEDAALRRINTIVNSSIRRVVAREKLQDLVSGNRKRLMSEILTESAKEAAPLGIAIVDVRIKRAELPDDNAAAVFRRMRTEREKEAKEIRATGAEKAQKIRAEAERTRTVTLAEAERDAQKLRGEGEGKAIAITGKAFNQDREFFGFLRSLEAYAASLGSGTTMVLDPSSKFMETFKGK
ncbi:MAG: protease modulator HflC [Alphaproteobacteria bacterium]